MGGTIMTKSCLLLTILIMIPLICIGGTGFFVVVSPALSLDNFSPFSGSYKPDLEDLNRYFDLPPAFSGGLNIELGKSTAYVNMDLRQEFSSFLTGNHFSNLPFSPGSIVPAVDMNFPRIGYYQWLDENVHLSIGRRKLSLGPATYSFVLSDVLPYFDNLWIRLSAGGKAGEYFYNFFAISADRTIYGAPKTLLGHRFGFMNEKLKVTFGEENLVYGVYPDLQDLGPFLIYHHTYQDRSNVTATLAAEVKFGESLIYGEFTLDDFRLASEGSNSNPTAFGWLAGISYSIPGEAYAGPDMIDRKHAIRDETLAAAGGMKLFYEHYHATTYLYNRGEDIGKFTYAYRFNVLWLDSWPIVSGFFGFPYGPDSVVDLVGVKYERPELSLTGLLEYVRTGSIDINSTYFPPFDTDWYGPKEPIKRSVSLFLKGLLAIGNDAAIFASAKLMFKERFYFYMNLGFIKTFTILGGL